MSLEQTTPVSLKSVNITDICATLLLLISGIVLLGWAIEFRPLTAFANQPLFPTMKGNTATAFLMLGMGLFGLRRHYQPLVLLCACSTLLLSGCAQFEYLFNVNLGINDILFDDNWSAINPGRMSFASAVGLGLAAILLMSHETLSHSHPKIFSVMILALLLEPLIAINTYAADLRSITALDAFANYSLPTTFAFMVFAIGIVSFTKTGVSGLVRGQNNAAKLFRRSLLGVFIATVAFSALSAWLSAAQFTSPEMASALFNTTLILLMIFVVSSCHHSLQEQQTHSAQSEPIDTVKFDIKEKALLEILSAADEGILLIDERRRILNANEGATRIFGWNAEEFQEKTIEALVPDRYRKSDIGQFHSFLLSNERTRNFDNRGKAIGLTKRGYEKPLSISLYKCKKISRTGDIEELHQSDDNSGVDPHITGNDVYVAAFFRELSGLETEMAEFNHRHRIDRLTGLPNHEEFLRYCAQFNSAESRKDDSHLCLMIIDLDNLKLLNERYDRDFGDRVLQNVTTTLKHRLRNADRLFRYNNDEFVLISFNTPPHEAELLAERMRMSVKVSPTKLEGKNIYITCSIGVSVTDATEIDLRNQVEALVNELHETHSASKDHVTSLPWPQLHKL